MDSRYINLRFKYKGYECYILDCYDTLIENRYREGFVFFPNTHKVIAMDDLERESLFAEEVGMMNYFGKDKGWIPKSETITLVGFGDVTPYCIGFFRLYGLSANREFEKKCKKIVKKLKKIEKGKAK